jgi:tripartite ATP-independent transporter DctP family solute receptor
MTKGFISKFTMVLAIFVAAGLIFTTSLSAEPKYPITIKAGHVVPDNFLYDTGLRKFSEIVEAGTNGDIKIEIYPAGQLGSERELIEAVQTGIIGMTIVSGNPATGFVPDIGVFSLPFIFDSWDEAYDVFDGPIGQKVMDKFDEVGLKCLTLYNGGPQGVLSHFPVRTPADLKGKKIRVMETPILLDAMRGLGALPTAIPYGELYTSLQQKVVDGASTCIQLAYLFKFGEVIDHVTFYNLIDPAPHLMNKKLYDSLPRKYQRLIVAAAKVGNEFGRMDVADGGPYGIAETLKKFADEQRVTVTKADIPAFQKAMKPVWKKYEKQYGKELIMELDAK